MKGFGDRRANLVQACLVDRFGFGPTSEIYLVRRLRMAFQQAGGQGPLSTLAKPQRFSDAAVYATTCSLACFIFRFVHGPLLTVAVVPALLATPSAALGDSVSSALVAARPIYGDDVLEDHSCLTPCPHADHSVPG